MRKTAMLSLAAWVLFFSGLGRGAAGLSEDWKRNIEDLIRASKAEVGLAYKDLGSGETYFFQEKLSMHAASTMKVPIMIEVFRQAESGKLALDDPLTVKNDFRSLMDGSPFSLKVEDDSEESLYRREGEGVAVRELVEKMITVSSNLATNLLIEKVGLSGVRATLEALGAPGLKVIRCLEDIKAYEAGLINTTDALSLMTVMEAIADGRAAGESSCREMTAILARQTFVENIPAGLPAGTRTANKTGWITRICHDAAIVFPEGRKPYVLVVLTRGIDDRSAAAKLIAGISSLVYNHAMGMNRQ